MELEARFLQALRESRPAYDEPPDWRAGLALYGSLSETEQRELDRLLVRMIDEDYRNPHSSIENLPFDDVMVNLPAGMSPDDLLCIEAAVLVAAERRVGEAFFAFNRLMRAPRWHAMFPRLFWLNYQGFEAQRQLGMTRAGRGLGALLGVAVAGLAAGSGGGVEPLIAAVPAAIIHGDRASDAADGPSATFQLMLHALLEGSSKAAAISETGLSGALALAARAFLETDSLERCLVRAAEFGSGPSAIAGGLAGSFYGPLAVPRRWTADLKDRAQLEEKAEALYAAYLSTH